MIPKLLDKITKDDIDALMQNQVAEGRDIEYKATLPGASDGEKKEFLADVSSFANAGGGEILYGITESSGIPSAITGLVVPDQDAELQRLDSILRNGVDPRIPGLAMHFVEGFTSGPVLALRVPKSWMGPHMIKFQSWSRFYSRNNAGKQLLDTAELRAAFALSEAMPERIKRFRDVRISQIMARQAPVPIVDAPTLLLHLLPVSSFSRPVEIPTGKLPRLQPISSSGWSHRTNIDGVVTYSGPRGGATGSRDYCQVYRSGRIEAVNSDIVRVHNGTPFIASVAYERDILAAVKQYVNAMKEMGIDLPIVVSMCLLNAEGAHMFVDASWGSHGAPVDRPVLVLPDVLLEEFTSDTTTLMRPIFDAVWNACGFERSFNYDAEGNWNPRH